MVKKVRLATAINKTRERRLEQASNKGMGRNTPQQRLPVVLEGECVRVASPESGLYSMVTLPGRLLGRAVYGTFFYASYGVVSATLMVLSCVPRNSAVGKGLHDGQEAARTAFAARTHPKARESAWAPSRDTESSQKGAATA